MTSRYGPLRVGRLALGEGLLLYKGLVSQDAGGAWYALSPLLKPLVQSTLLSSTGGCISTLLHPVDASRWGLNFDPGVLGYPSPNWLNVRL